MKLLRPYTIAPGILSSNIPLSDAAEYSASAAYGVGSRVMSTTGTSPTFRKYESLVAGNIGNALDDTSKWLDLGPVNRWAMFDTKNGTTTTSASNIAVSAGISGRVDGLALFGLDAEQINVAMTYDGSEHSNLITYSQDYSNAAWNKQNVTLGASILAPDGTATASTLNEGTATGTHGIFQVPTLEIDKPYTWSIYAKAGSASVLQLVFDHITGFTDYANFNLATGTVTVSVAGVTASIVDAGNGWFRCIMSGVVTTSSSGLYAMIGNGDSYGRLASYAGTNRSLYLWGAQLEQSAFPTSYIATTSETVTTTTNTAFMAYYSLQSDSGVNSWFDYFTEAVEYNTDLVVTDLPVYANPTVSVSIIAADGVVSCGTMVVGQTRDLGGTVYGAKGGIQDYSRKETDDFGNYTLIERSFAKRNTFRVVCENNSVDAIFNLLAEVRATPVVWLGSDDYAMTWSYGWARDWAVEISYPTKSFLTIEIEGLT